MYEDLAKAQTALSQTPGVAGATALPAARRAEIERAAGAIESLYGMLQEADLSPTPQLAAAVADAHAALAKLLAPAE